MNNEINALHIVHVFSVITMIALTIYACAAEPGTRKKVMTWSGITSLLALLTGLRLWQVMYHFQGGWVVVKIVCWLGIATIAGLAYRRREKAGLWIFLTLLLTLIALVMVFTRPF